MPRKIKIIIERHEAGYVAYPLGLRDGVSIVGEGDSYDDALEYQLAKIGVRNRLLTRGSATTSEPRL